MAYHSYSDDERMAFTEHINNCLASDPVSMVVVAKVGIGFWAELDI